MSKYGVISGPYFPVFGLNTGRYGPEITLYLDTFHPVNNVHESTHIMRNIICIFLEYARATLIILVKNGLGMISNLTAT